MAPMSNRATVTAPAGRLGPEQLPPVRSDGRLRVLTITGYALGWRTYAASLASTTARRDDVDAVHVHVVLGRLDLLAGARLPGPQLGGWFDSHLRRTLAGQRSLRRWLRGVDLSRFDVIHVTPQFVGPGLLPRRDQAILTLGIDATSAQAKAQRNGIGADEARRRFRPLLELEAKVFAGVDGVVSMNQWAVDDLDEATRAKTVVIAPSVPVHPSVHVGPDDGPVKLLFVGNDWVRKGGPRLLAWHQERYQGRAELHVCSADAPVDPGLADVVWHGATPHDELLTAILPEMDALVLPTRSDMSPWAVVEAAAAGLPVVSSHIGAIGEIIEHGSTGHLLEPDDDAGFVAALDAIVGDADHRAGLRDAARARAEVHLDHQRLGDLLVDHWWALHRARPSADPGR